MQTRVPAWLKALLLATCIRLLHVGVLYVSSHTLQDYDTSAPLGARACVAHAVNATPPIAPPGQTLDHSNLTQQSWTWRLVVWDSVFYTDIACNGYRYEQQYAFFPLLPAFMRALSRATSLSIPVSGLLISAAASILAAPLTLLLNTSITGDVTLSAAATLLFILNPASIFHAAIYTESLFTLLTLGGVCCLYVKPQPQPSPPHAGLIAVRFVAAAACFCLASCTRSNGVINAGFLLHAALQQAVLTWIPFLKPFLKNSVSFKPGEASAARATTTKTTGTTGAHHSLSQSPHHKRLQSLACAVTTTAVWGTAAVIGAAVVAAPLLLHQAHASASFCTHAQHQHTICGHCPAAVRAAVTAIWGPGVDVGATANTGNIDSGAMGGLVGKYHRPWCTDSPWKLSAYGFVQRQYWGVGFMEYWTLQQIPNFLLAAPVLVLSLAGIWTYIRSRPLHVATGGLFGLGTEGETLGAGGTGFLSPAVAVFIYPWAFMVGCAILVMHVQVATRFLSGCPPLYWFMARLCLQAQDKLQQQHTTNRHGGCLRAGSSTGRQIDGGDNHDDEIVQQTWACKGEQGAEYDKAAAGSSGSGGDAGGVLMEGGSSVGTTMRKHTCQSGTSQNKDASDSHASELGNKRAGAARQPYRGQFKVGSAVWLWCWVYFVAGFVLFPNFYPWT